MLCSSTTDHNTEGRTYVRGRSLGKDLVLNGKELLE